MGVNRHLRKPGKPGRGLTGREPPENHHHDDQRAGDRAAEVETLPETNRGGGACWFPATNCFCAEPRCARDPLGAERLASAMGSGAIRCDPAALPPLSLGFWTRPRKSRLDRGRVARTSAPAVAPLDKVSQV